MHELAFGIDICFGGDAILSIDAILYIDASLSSPTALYAPASPVILHRLSSSPFESARGQRVRLLVGPRHHPMHPHYSPSRRHLGPAALVAGPASVGTPCSNSCRTDCIPWSRHYPAGHLDSRPAGQSAPRCTFVTQFDSLRLSRPSPWTLRSAPLRRMARARRHRAPPSSSLRPRLSRRVARSPPPHLPRLSHRVARARCHRAPLSRSPPPRPWPLRGDPARLRARCHQAPPLPPPWPRLRRRMSCRSYFTPRFLLLSDFHHDFEIGHFKFSIMMDRHSSRPWAGRSTDIVLQFTPCGVYFVTA